MKKIIGVIAIVFALAIGIFFAYSALSEKRIKNTVTIGYRTHDLYAPLFVGLEKGFFEKEGIYINPIKFESTNQLTDALLAGKIDAVLGGANMPLLLTIEDKSPGQLKIFSIVHEDDKAASSAVIIKQDSQILSMKDLQGKKIGAFPGSTAQLIYRKMLSPYFDPSQSTLTQMKPELLLASLESGQIDAAIVLEPAATIAVSKNVARILERSLFHTYIQKNIPVAASALSSTFAKRKPDIANKLINATNRSIEFINSHQDEAKMILPKYTSVDPEIAKKITLPTFDSLSTINPEELQGLADILLEEHELKGTIKINTLLYQNR